MRSGFARSVAAAVIGGAAVLMTGSSVALGSTTGPKVLVLPTVVVTAKAEPHPEIMAAIRSLEHAREHLEHAAHDFGGHRVEAIGAIDAALNQLRLALKYDRR